MSASFASTRRGLLGLLAAAAPAAAIAVLPVPATQTQEPPAKPRNRQDCIDEAVEAVRVITAKRDSFPPDTRQYAVQQILLNWWSDELRKLRTIPEYWREDAA